MKKFVFSLERVLQIREDEEREALIQMKRAEEEYIQEVNTLKELEEKRDISEKKSFEDLFLKKQNVIYIEFLNSKIHKQMIKVNEKQAVLQEKKAFLLKKNMEKKSLEKLKEIKQEEYFNEQERIEKRVNDEFAINSFNFKNLKGGEKVD